MPPLEGPVVGALFRFRDFNGATADGAGAAEVRFVPPAGQYWLVERIRVVTGDATGTAEVYVLAVAPQNFEDRAGGMPLAADYQSAIYVPQAAPLIVLFAGVTAGQPCTAGIQALAYPVAD